MYKPINCLIETRCAEVSFLSQIQNYLTVWGLYPSQTLYQFCSKKRQHQVQPVDIADSFFSFLQYNQLIFANSCINHIISVYSIFAVFGLYRCIQCICKTEPQNASCMPQTSRFHSRFYCAAQTFLNLSIHGIKNVQNNELQNTVY